VHHVDAADVALEVLGREMEDRAVARRSIGILAGFFFISSTRPLTESGIEGWVTSTSGLTQIEEIGVKSLTASYGGLTKAVGLMAWVEDGANSSV
jgi:hypothetical protein